MPARLSLCLEGHKPDHNTCNRGSPKTKSVIHPSIFKKMSVCVQSDSPSEIVAIHKAMTIIGATIKEDAGDADIVISQTRWSPHSPPRANISSTGSKMVLELVHQRKEVKNVLISQIPWVEKLASQHKSPEHICEKPTTEKKIVVADVRGILAPKACFLAEMPTLCFTKVPKECHNCPFDKINENSKPCIYRERPKYSEHPPNHGYCEICNMQYNKAVDHQHSREHIHHAQHCSWTEFDILARQLYRL